MADALQPSESLGRQPSAIGPLQITVAIVVVLASLLPMPLPLFALAPVIAIVLTPFAGWLSMAFLCVVTSLSGVLDYLPVRVGPINVYAIDAIALLFFWTIVHAVLHYNRTGEVPAFENRQERRIVAIWAIWCALGIFFLAYGLVLKGYAFDRAFGDFRRQVWYAAAFFIPLFFPYTKRHLATLKYVILIAGFVTILIGLYRIASGSPARVDENYATGHLGARWLWIVECMTISTLLAYLVVVLRSGTGLVQKAIAIPLCFPAVMLLFISGWRLAMFYSIAAPLAALLLWMWARKQPIRGFVGGVVAIGVAAVVPLLAAPLLFPDFVGDTLLDLRMRLLNDAVRGGFRTWATQASLAQFFSSPIAGKGFGYYIVVAIRNQAGSFDYAEMNNAHNLFLTVLYQTGILGFVPFVMFHALFVVQVLRSVRSIPSAVLPTFVALFVGYLCFMGYANTQPFVSSQFIIMHFIMGFLVRLTRTTSLES